MIKHPKLQTTGLHIMDVKWQIYDLNEIIDDHSDLLIKSGKKLKY